jgi:hypothetical protein
MEGTLGALVRALVEQGKGETLAGGRFFPLVTLDSGTRVGLDAEARFALASEDGTVVVPQIPEDGHLFHEALEWKRNTFDDALEEGARAHGLPPLEVSLAFPTPGIVRAVLAKNMHYTTRLALQWLRPSELRDVRDDLHRVADDRRIPTALRDLARRLLVPT